MFKVAQSTVHQSLNLSVLVRMCKGLKTTLSVLSQMPPAFLSYFKFFFIKYFSILSFPNNNSQILPNYLPSQLNGSLSLKTETATKQNKNQK